MQLTPQIMSGSDFRISIYWLDGPGEIVPVEPFPPLKPAPDGWQTTPIKEKKPKK
jgi:hypothetical protein